MRILFDINRLVWGARRSSPSGIDRVVVAYGQWLDEHPNLELAPVVSFRGRLYRITLRRFRAILADAQKRAAPRPDESSRWAVLEAALASPAKAPALRWSGRTQGVADWPATIASLSYSGSGFPLRVGDGDIYLNVGHTGLSDTRLLPNLSAKGVNSVALIHDLIPLTHPEFCSPGSGEKHVTRLSNVMAQAALVLTNSASTSNAIRQWAEASNIEAPRLVDAPLGLEPAFLKPAESILSTAPYFVCVGTIEARKNLPLLLGLWRRLFEEMGDKCPALVMVGLRGWENEAVIDHLERSQSALKLVHEVSELSDEHLAQLIGGARALLAPSFAEGYDLPALEALSLGARVIASNIPAHRELARGAELIDPLDGMAWLKAISGAASKPGKKSARFKAPTWDAHFAIVDQALGELGVSPPQ